MSIFDDVTIKIPINDEDLPMIRISHMKSIIREYVNNKDLSKLSKLEFKKIESLLNNECPNCKKSVWRSFKGLAEDANGRIDIEFYDMVGINILCPNCLTNITVWDEYFAYLFNYACTGKDVYLNNLTSDYRFKLEEKRKKEISEPLSVKDLLSKNTHMNKYEDLLLKVKEGLINSEKVSNGCITFSICESYSNEDIKKLKNFYNADTGFKNIEVTSLDDETNFKFYYE